MPFYSQAFFQQYKRRRAFGQTEPSLSEAGDIHTYKRQILKNLKVEDTGQDRKNLKKEQAKELRKFKSMKRKELESELTELKEFDQE